MSTLHTVKQGEHLSRLAEQYGFSDYRTIWNHPENAKLKQSRQNPDVLYPGDEVFIPDRELREEVRSTDQRHNFVLSRTKLRLRVAFELQFENPVANASCMLSVNADFRPVKTDGAGKIDEEIPLSAEKA